MAITFNQISNKALSLLRVRSVSGGLEVSDQVLRLVYSNGAVRNMAAVRLEPGVLENGIIKQPEAFRAALTLLRSKMVGVSPKQRVNVTLVLSSVAIYSQVFALPIIEGAELDKAIELNVQMLSPMDMNQVYYGSQILGRDEKTLRLEILAAFVDRHIVDESTTALFDAGFLPVIVESRALALMRLLGKQGAGIDPQKSYLLIIIDNAGIDFIVVRHQGLYFEYSNRWVDLADERGEVSVERFEETLAGSFRQVLNFYEQHWPEPLVGVTLSASAFEDVAEKTIQGISSLPLVPLVIADAESVKPEWYAALGANMRSLRLGAKEVNLAGRAAESAFREEQMINFADFWRVVIPISFGLLLVTFGLAQSFIGRADAALASKSGFQNQSASLGQINILEASATAFNQSVSMVNQIEQESQPKYHILADINAIAATTSVMISHVSFTGGASPVFVSGSAASEEQVVAFKSAIEADPRFGTVDLPLGNIQLSGNTVTFMLNFPVSASAFQ